MRRAFLVVLLAVVGLGVTAGTAAAYEPVNIVHTERVQAGPYELTVGFSTWPLRALRSLDFTFTPADGIAGKSGSLEVTGPAEAGIWSEPLARHPRKRDVWGLDVRSLDTQGNWTFRFVIDGASGRGVGTLPNVPVLAQPGPPLALSWSISVLPLIGIIAFLAVAWRRTRPVDMR
jgi:hypothetical protein